MTDHTATAARALTLEPAMPSTHAGSWRVPGPVVTSPARAAMTGFERMPRTIERSA